MKSQEWGDSSTAGKFRFPFFRFQISGFSENPEIRFPDFTIMRTFGVPGFLLQQTLSFPEQAPHPPTGTVFVMFLNKGFVSRVEGYIATFGDTETVLRISRFQMLGISGDSEFRDPENRIVTGF